MEVRVKSTVNVTSRLKTLYYVIYEMAEAFGADEDALNTIEKGVLRQQVLQKIVINYINVRGDVIGRVTLAIDWEEHRLRASTDYGCKFELIPGKSVRSQISEVSDKIIDHVNCMRSSMDIRKITTRYYFTDDIYSDKERLRNTREYMGLKGGEKLPEKIDPVFEETFRCIFSKLGELSISVSERI